MSDGDFQTEGWERPKVTLKELVHKDNMVFFSHFKEGKLYYAIVEKAEQKVGENGVSYVPDREVWEFPIPIEDTGSGKFNWQDKASLYMRWIRKAIEDQTIRKI